jgi:hypothetical protein
MTSTEAEADEPSAHEKGLNPGAKAAEDFQAKAPEPMEDSGASGRFDDLGESNRFRSGPWRRNDLRRPTMSNQAETYNSGGSTQQGTPTECSAGNRQRGKTRRTPVVESKGARKPTATVAPDARLDRRAIPAAAAPQSLGPPRFRRGRAALYHSLGRRGKRPCVQAPIALSPITEGNGSRSMHPPYPPPGWSIQDIVHFGLGSQRL